MEQLRDLRSLTQPDVSHSAYCMVCWEPIYTMWIDEDHEGKCPNGATKVEECPTALRMCRNRVGAQRLLDKQPTTGED